MDRFGLNRELTWYPYRPTISGSLPRLIRMLFARGWNRFRSARRREAKG
jgi:hypothetical protein